MAWQWAAIIVGGLALAYIIRNRAGGTPAGVADPGGELVPVELPDGTAGYMSNIDGAARAPSPDDDAPTTNQEWLREASRRLIQNGSHAATVIDTALRLYLQGDPLDAEQVAVIELALTMIGPPPEGAFPIIREAPETDHEPVQPEPAPRPRTPSPSPAPTSPVTTTTPTPRQTGQTGSVGADDLFTSGPEILARAAQIRANRGLPPDPASDAEWRRRIEAGTHTLGDVRTNLENRAGWVTDNPV